MKLTKTNNIAKQAIIVIAMSLITVVWISQRSLSNVVNPRDPYVANASHKNIKPREKGAVNSKLRAENKTSFIKPRELPIFLIQPSSNAIYLTNWGRVASTWGRGSQYEHLIQEAETISSLPLINITEKRPVVVLHCGPKTGSTTLRLACKKDLETSCGIVTKSIIEPVAYGNTTGFYSLVRSCPKTSHFCAKGITMPLEISAFDDVHFIHMFPFRNYDDWAISAMKQSFDRWGEKGCAKLRKTFFQKNCSHYKWELDFPKYSKSDLSMYKEYIVKRMNEKNESHSFLLYHHRELEDVLGFLSDFYKIRKLSGSDKHHKGSRPEGTCSNDILEKFHKCFSGQLMKLV